MSASVVRRSELLDVPAVRLVDEVHARRHLHRRDVAIQAHEVEDRAVEHVTLHSGCPTLLVVFQLPHLGAERGGQTAGLVDAEASP